MSVKKPTVIGRTTLEGKSVPIFMQADPHKALRYVRETLVISWDIYLNGVRTQMYFAPARVKRLSFQVFGVWCFVQHDGLYDLLLTDMRRVHRKTK